MTDRELLERAARAAGVCLHPEDKLHRSYGNWGCDTTCMVCKKDPSTATFRPLTDDSDAFRLLTNPKLGLELHGFGALREVIFMLNGEPQSEEVEWPHTPAATRLALVRAAAAMAPEEAE